MKHKQRFLLVLVVLLALLPATACQQEEKEKEPETFKVGYVTLAPVPAIVTGLVKSSMAALGYVEGENVTYVILNAGGDLNALPQVAQELVDADADVGIVVGALIAQEIMAITEDIPLVVVDREVIQQGLVDSRAGHGRNLTAVLTAPPAPLQLHLLLEIAPGVERIFVPIHPDLESETLSLAALAEAAADSGVELVVGEARNDDEVADMLANDFPDDIDAIFMPVDRITHFPRTDETFVPFAIDHKLPLFVSSETSVANGALACYAIDLVEITKQAIRLVDQILQGTPASDLPIEQAEYFLHVNLKTAEAIGLDIPEDVLERARNIIRE